MDANVTLAEIRALIAEAREHETEDRSSIEECQEAVRKFEKLDDWLSRGGRLPKRWGG